MFVTRSDRLVLSLFFFAAQAPDFSVGPVRFKQLFEVCVILFLPYLLLRLHNQYRAEPALLFFPFIIYSFYTAVYAYFTLSFFPAGDFGFFKRPLILSFSRISQLCLLFFAFNYAWSVIRSLREAEWAIRRYLLISGTIAVATIASYFIAKSTGYLPRFVYDTAPYEAISSNDVGQLRARGLFNEGGPYGLSLSASLFLCYLLRASEKQIGWWLPLSIGAAFILSQSKAGLLACLILGSLYAFSHLSLKRFLIFVGFSMLLLAGLATAYSDFLDGYLNYFHSIESIASRSLRASHTDGNLAFGRVAGFLIGPKMFLAHPFLGSGLGNYSLMRNDPDYLGPLPPVQGWDLPGIGIFTILIENGAIGFIIVLASYLLFYLRTRKSIQDKRLRFLFWLPLVVQFASVQYYFAYHWVYLALYSLFLARGSVRNLPTLSEEITRS